MQAFSIWLILFSAVVTAHPAADITQPPPIPAYKDSPYLNEKSRDFLLNGTNIPGVPFDIGEHTPDFCPFPLIHTNLASYIFENGPFIHQPGTYAPVRNRWAWTNLTNMIWIEQPVGTGFSQGTPNITNEEELAAQFLGFFKNFLDTFGLYQKKVFLSGESYAGKYIPYIADAMFKQNDTEYFDVRGILIYDPSINDNGIMLEGLRYTLLPVFRWNFDIITLYPYPVPSMAFVDKWRGLFPFNTSFNEELHSLADSCGFTSYLKEHLVYPPKGKLPPPPSYSGSCDVVDAIWNAATLLNPCFNVYQVSTTCPTLWDTLGFPGSFEYVPAGAQVYFNRTDVQKAINAPLTSWSECSEQDVFVDALDTSPQASYSVLPAVIERLNRTIIAHGALDFVLLAQGTLLTIQNMTWNGFQGFTAEPSSPLFVPYHEDGPVPSYAGAGVMGTYRTERGLTYAELFLAGHMGPQNSPAASYRLVEFLLGRIDDLSS
ncbi:hypothetical protein ACJ72_06330 [Emergomyces africanus]|uniref:Carboxypeptidase n=1 Tax=Emergomyces africanus TaxID=1955775 RepID=A0A1B7NRP4_9EURO|nr:hypothetical protein ACJ72_06330 [Emergomyces africanus]